MQTYADSEADIFVVRPWWHGDLFRSDTCISEGAEARSYEWRFRLQLGTSQI